MWYRFEDESGFGIFEIMSDLDTSEIPDDQEYRRYHALKNRLWGMPGCAEDFQCDPMGRFWFVKSSRFVRIAREIKKILNRNDISMLERSVSRPPGRVIYQDQIQAVVIEEPS